MNSDRTLKGLARFGNIRRRPSADGERGGAQFESGVTTGGGDPVGHDHGSSASISMAAASGGRVRVVRPALPRRRAQVRPASTPLGHRARDPLAKNLMEITFSLE